MSGSPSVKSVTCGCFVILFVCHVHSGLHQYLWFSGISSTVANRNRKSTSLFKRGVSITSISKIIKLVNIAFQSVPCIHAEWAILGGDVRDASRLLLYFCIERLRQALNIAMIGLYYVQMWKWIVMIFLCDIFSGARRMLESLHNHRQSQQPTGRNGGLLGADAEKKIVFHDN